MEQAHNNDFPPSSTLGTTPSNAHPIDSSPLEVPRFLETRSQQIIARLKLLEEKVSKEINSFLPPKRPEEKTSIETFDKLNDLLQKKVQEIKTEMTLKIDFILVSEVLQILSKEEENLLEIVRTNLREFVQTKCEKEDENENGSIHSNTSRISKKVITKIERKDNQKRKKIPYRAVAVLKQWLFDHIQDPYPSNQVKEELAKKTNLNFKQVHNWFINARGRIWKKMVHQERFGNVVEKLYVQKVNKDKK